MSKKSLDSSPTVSPDFASDTSDITFQSTDGVLFQLHRKNLEVSAGAFPPAAFQHDPADGPVKLSEPAATLAVLFQFIYPQRRPKIDPEISFELLHDVAQAAEKYELTWAMDMCDVIMRKFLGKHALEILVYATRNQYVETIDVASSHLLSFPFVETMNKLPQHLIRPWAIYHYKHKPPARGLSTSNVKFRDLVYSVSPLLDTTK